MGKKSALFLLAGIFLLGITFTAFAQSAEESFKKVFPALKFDAFNSTGIKGIYEVVIDGTNIIYFAAEPGYLFVGEIWDRNRINITANRISEIILSKAKALPLDKAIKIGTGKNIAIEFTDPDCPYCRKASLFFSQKTDVTRYVFFLPLPMHKDAENKVKYVFCAQDKAQAYEEAMTGKLDSMKYEACTKPEANDLLKAHKEIAEKMGISGTPFFIVNNKAISGANFAQIEAALKSKDDAAQQK
ncbi:MAG: protein-disulfide isomerase [Syntrophus sp. (in: bacteria)]|nr:protein-disulfide isomerase [Syntrophus sp. (in: bacteria)]